MPTILNNSSHKALTTLARTKTFLGIGSDKYDSLLIQLINQVTGFVEKFTARNFLRQTYTNEEYDGSGTDTLLLKNFPVASVTTLQFNRAADNTDDWETIGTDRYFAKEDGRIILVGRSGAFLDVDAGYFIDAPNKYRATYVAGYLIDFNNENDPAQHTLPEDIEYLTHMLVSSLFNTRKSVGFSSAKVGDQSISLRKAVFESPDIKEILEKYRVPAV